MTRKAAATRRRDARAGIGSRPHEPGAQLGRPPGTARLASGFGILALLAFLLRVANVIAQRGNPFSSYLPVDQMAYDFWARRIAEGEWIGRAIFYQDPLYPYFLGAFYALFGRALTALGVVQGLLGSANVVLLGAVTSRLAGRRAGWIAAGIAALYGPFVFYDGLVLKTFLEVLTLNAAVWVLLATSATGGRGSVWRGVAAGAVLGLGSLARANYLALAPLALLWLLFFEKAPGFQDRASSAARLWLRPPTQAERAAALGILAGLGIVLLPVLARNRAVGGDWVLTTAQAGQNFYIGNNPENRRGVYQAPSFVRPDPQHEQEDFHREAERRTGRALKPSEASRFWADEARRYVAAHPGRFLGQCLTRVGLLLHRHEIPDNEDYRFWARFSPGLRWNPVRFDLLGPLAIAGLVLGWWHRQRLALLYLLLGGYLASVALFFVLGRYRLPAASLMIPFAALAMDEGIRLLREPGRHRRLTWGALALLAGIVLVHRPSREEEPVLSPSLLSNLGSAYLSQGRVAEAVRVHRQAVEAAPSFADARYNLGIALHASGDSDGAMKEFRRVLEMKPDYAEAWSYLGNLLDAEGKGPEAHAAHARARRLQPDRGIHLFNLARIAAQMGRTDEALALADTLAAMRDREYAPQAVLIQAPLLAQRGEYARASDLLRAFLQARPQHPQRVPLEGALREWEARASGEGRSPSGTRP